MTILTIVAGCQSQSSFSPVAPTANTSHSSRILPDAPPPVSAPGTPNSSETTSNSPTAKPIISAPAAYILREGDVLRLSFPGSPSLNTVQQIRSDGKINLPLVGEVNAAGLTTDELQKKLVSLYAPQLTTKEVIVEVQSSSFPVYVTGAVLHPGKISTDHPITALEAIMEAGGFDYTTANLKDVEVIRQEGAQTKHYQLNLKKVMDGKSSEPFFMKPGDIIYVPEKFSWF